MTEVQKLILDIENDLKKISIKARSLNPAEHGYFQQRVILNLQKAIRGLLGWEIGELKNLFGMNDFGHKRDEKLRAEIESLARKKSGVEKI